MTDWLDASILWVEQRDTKSGRVCEVVYEVGSEPDMLRQIEVAEADLYAGARRGDTVAINLFLKQIRPRRVGASRNATTIPEIQTIEGRE
jgi:hypothetical protein